MAIEKITTLYELTSEEKETAKKILSGEMELSELKKPKPGPVRTAPAPEAQEIPAPAPAERQTDPAVQPAPAPWRRSPASVIAMCAAITVLLGVIAVLLINSAKPSEDTPAPNEPSEQAGEAVYSTRAKEKEKTAPKTENVFSAETGDNKSGGSAGSSTFSDLSGGKFTYEGELKDGKPDGKGKGTWLDGGVYDGEWKNGLREGEGTYTTFKGSVYTGQWANDTQNGEGTYEESNGNSYTGGWKDGKYHGSGKYTYFNGDYYEGEWENGERSGIGTRVTHLEGLGTCKYVGEFKNDKENGEGTFYYPDGSSSHGTWKDGILVYEY